MNIAIIGCGGISAFVHIPQLLQLKDRVHITYLCDKQISRAEKLVKRYSLSGVTCTTNSDIIFNDSHVDAVIIAVWPCDILSLSIKSIKSNKHTLIQKPIIGSIEELNELLTLSFNNKTINILTLPCIDCTQLKKIITSGMLGDIKHVKIHVSIPGPSDYYEDVRLFFGEEEGDPYHNKLYAQGRGALSDMGPYALSLFYDLFGEGKLISSVMYPTKELDELALLNIYSTTFCASIDIAWNQTQGNEICAIYGNKGSISIHANGSISTLGFSDKIYNCKIKLPVSPYEAQEKWILQILAENEHLFTNDSVISAVWSANIIKEAYEKRLPQ